MVGVAPMHLRLTSSPWGRACHRHVGQESRIFCEELAFGLHLVSGRIAYVLHRLYCIKFRHLAIAPAHAYLLGELASVVIVGEFQALRKWSQNIETLYKDRAVSVLQQLRDSSQA